MYRYPTENIFDEDIDCILSFLFEYQSAEQKQQRYSQTPKSLNNAL